MVEGILQKEFSAELGIVFQPFCPNVKSRDIDEIFINNYNPEWIVNWNANIDIFPVFDYFGNRHHHLHHGLLH